MIAKLQQNQWVKAGTGFWLLNLAKTEQVLFYLLILLLPTQFGKHFWFDFSFVLGSRIDFLSPTLYVTDVLIVFLFLLTLFKKRISISPSFSLFVLFLSLGIFFSGLPMVGWYYLGKFLEVSFLTWYVVHAEYNKIIVGTLLASGLLLESMLVAFQLINQGAVGGLFYFLGERAFSGTTPGVANASIDGQLILRPYGTFSHPNMLAGYIVIILLLLPTFLSIKSAMQKIIISLSLILGTASLAFSLSRAGLMAWVLSGIVFLSLTFKERANRMILFAGVIAVTSFLVASLFFPSIIFRTLSFSFGQSLSERALLASQALSLILLHPIFGVGLGNFIPSLPSVANNQLILQPVHNIYLLIAAETGFIGLSVFLLFILQLFKLLIKARRRQPVGEKNNLLLFTLSLGTILFIGFFDHYFLTLQQGQILFGLTIGFALREARATFATIQK